MATHKKSNCSYQNSRGLIKGAANLEFADEHYAILNELKAQKLVATKDEILDLVLADKGKTYPRHWALADKKDPAKALRDAQSGAITAGRRRVRWFKKDIGALLPVFIVVSQTNGVDTKWVVGVANDLIKTKAFLDQIYNRYVKQVEHGQQGIALVKKVVLSCTGHNYKP